MMISSVQVDNFRGIQSAKFIFPLDQRVICIIGAGDSGKSTLLTAIEWALWPTWNLNVADTDFYCGNTDNPISIAVTVTEIPEILLNEEKYGLYLRNVNAIAKEEENDEPVDGDILGITIRLLVDETLDPKWEVITNRSDPKVIGSRDRQYLNIGVVGFDYEKDFLWGRNSILQKYVNSKAVLRDAYKCAIRSAVETVKLTELDQTSETLKNTGMQYGVHFNGEIHNKIIMQNGSFSTTVGVFDGAVPFVQRGLGSKRLLSMGMNINTTEGSCVLLVDEVETGLEPYRICGLINEFRRTHVDCGQVIMTTHSQNVITECSIGELAVITSNAADTSFTLLNSEDSKVNDMIQSMLRSDPSAFLCRRIIVCEGKTEIGLLRALDRHLMQTENVRFSYYGVGTAFGGGGDKMFKFAKLLKKCGYEVSILMDSDEKTLETKKDIARSEGIKIFDWTEGFSVENQIFSDAPIDAINKLLSLAVQNKTIQHVTAKLKDVDCSGKILISSESVSVAEDVDESILETIGEISKKSEWFKRIDLGESVGDLLLSHYDDIPITSRLRVVIDAIKDWVKNSERE